MIKKIANWLNDLFSKFRKTNKVGGITKVRGTQTSYYKNGKSYVTYGRRVQSSTMTKVSGQDESK